MAERNRTWRQRLDKALPWGLSVCVHVGIVLTMAFVVFQAAPSRPSGEGVSVALSPNSMPRRMTPRPMRTTMVKPGAAVPSAGAGKGVQGGSGVSAGFMPRWSEGVGEKSQPATTGLPGEGSGSGSGKDAASGTGDGLSLGGEPGDPGASSGDGGGDGAGDGGTATFFGVASPAREVVYVLDFSTSLSDGFDLIRREVIRSIGRLEEGQKFHVILFAGGQPVEAKGGMLAPATRSAKLAAVEFLGGVRPTGGTEPIGAITRAFSVLHTGGRNSKLICLLTDGVFPDTAEVLKTIRAGNAAHGVCINTYLYGGTPASARTMKQIADENGGQFVVVGPGEKR